MRSNGFFMKEKLHKFYFKPSVLNKKSIVVTGGTGSFGSNFVEKILKIGNPKKIVIFSRDEYKQYKLSEKLKKSDKKNVLRFFIGDVRDYERLNSAFRGIDFVIHAAALKHITSNEYNPFECIRTNVYGAENIVRAAINNSVSNVIALSTDKACSPVNLYGASKLAADKVFIAANFFASDRKTRFKVVRYGNVLGSRGSVIPFFYSLLKKGEKYIPITDKKMTRFWISLNQATEFVLSCLSDNTNGDLFIPKIPSIKIIDIAKAIAPKCKLNVIGIKPGEKIHETLISKEETRNTFEFKDRYILKFQNPSSNKISKVYGGKKVSENFEYSSNANSWWIKRNEILDFIQEAIKK